MSYILRNKTTGDYIGQSLNHKFMSVKNPDEAVMFYDSDSALKVAKNSLGKMFNWKDYESVSFKSNSPFADLDSQVTIDKSAKKLEGIKNIRNKDSIVLRENSINRIYDRIYSTVELIDNYYANEEGYKAKLKDVELKIIDLMHFVEFTELSASDGYKVYKTLQTLRQERREYKNIIAIIDEMKKNEITTDKLTTLCDGVKSLDNQEYFPYTQEGLDYFTKTFTSKHEVGKDVSHRFI